MRAVPAKHGDSDMLTAGRRVSMWQLLDSSSVLGNSRRGSGQDRGGRYRLVICGKC